MTSRKGRKAWAGELPVETLTALKEESSESDLPAWKIVDQALRMYLGLDEGSTEAALERQLEEIEDELETFEERQQRIQRERKEKEERMQLLKEQLEEVREKKATYKEQLEDILSRMVSEQSTTVMAYMEPIREAAIDEYGRDTKDNIDRVIANLQQHATKEDFQVEPHRFKRTAKNVQTDTKAHSDGGLDEPDLKFISESGGGSE